MSSINLKNDDGTRNCTTKNANKDIRTRVKGKEQYKSHNNKLYLHIGKVTDTIRKRRVTFCEHF